ncbi:MAG: VCBS repeat-containing protein [Flavobacteriales bacterium]
MRRFHFTCLMAALLIWSCGDKATDSARISPEDALFELIAPEASGIDFVNRVRETDSLHVFNYEYIYNGGGVAIGDINNDGLNDIYFSGSDVGNKLYLNEGNFRFRDITDKSGTQGGPGHKTGVCMVDINNDGWLDIHVCKSGAIEPEKRRNILYINNQDGTFTDRAAEYGLDDPSFSTQAYFADFDVDGDLDMFLVNHPVNWANQHQVSVQYDASGKLVRVRPTEFTYVSDRLYLNENGRFTDKSAEAGMLNVAFGLSASILDVNRDGLPDIYVCNDYIEPDYLYVNQGNGKFRNAFNEYFRHSSFSSMGSDAADLDNDGLIDLLTLDMVSEENHYQKMLQMAQNFDKFQTLLQYDYEAQFSINAVQRNNGNGTFSDLGLMTGMAFTDWSWAGLIEDYDLDGMNDVFITNGYRYDVSDMDYTKYRFDSLQRSIQLRGGNAIKEYRKIVGEHKVTNYFFRNQGEWAFENSSSAWNSGPPSFSNGAAYADLDNDGDLDLVVNNLEDPAFLMRNRAAEQKGSRALTVRFEGPEQNRQGVGAEVTVVYPDGHMLTRTLQLSRGFLSSVPAALTFPLSTSDTTADVYVRWPDGQTQTLSGAKTKEPLVFKFTEASFLITKKQDLKPLLTGENTVLNWRHQENDFIDFKREPLLHKEMSSQGPCMAVADVNNDGLDDLFLGGASGQSGALHIQQRDGTFRLSAQQAFEANATHEDVAAVFTDADSDGDKDLYVVSGGTEFPEGNPNYADRIYLNDGKGQFIRDASRIPVTAQAGSCIAAADVDGDGDEDLFRGAWVLPGKYPLSGKSMMLINDGGRYTDATTSWLADFSPHGILCSATFADLDGNSKPDLIMAGEWTSLIVLTNTGQSLKASPDTDPNGQWTGWWNCVRAADMDGDSDIDILAGNLGLNTRLRASAEQPVTLDAADFDNNGSMDAILSLYVQDKSYPIHLRDQLLDQMTVLKRKYLRYKQYADATFDDLFEGDVKEKAMHYDARMMESSWFENDGKGSFEIHAFPRMAQTSCILDMAITDVNKDGAQDIIAVGNWFDTDVQNSRYDASTGYLLLGNGKGGFEAVPPMQSGLRNTGNARCTAIVRTAQGACLIIANNNGPAETYQLPRLVDTVK